MNGLIDRVQPLPVSRGVTDVYYPGIVKVQRPARHEIPVEVTNVSLRVSVHRVVR